MEPVSILLVDDEARNLDSLEAILSGPEYKLLRAETSDRALRLLLDNEDVAAIVLDMQMPEQSGIELAGIIKGTKRFREIPIVFLTARMLDEQDIISGYGAGAVDYLTKPLNPQILKRKIMVFADLFRKTRELAVLNDELEARVKARTAELEKSELALHAAARQKDEFLAVLAHELRNPLAPLRTGVNLLVHQEAAKTPLVARTLGAMSRQVEHLVRLIDDLLDVSRISSGVLELKKEEADLAALVASSIDTFRSAFDQKKIQVTAELEAGMHAVVDATRIAQVIGNLLHNASKFTQTNGNVRVALFHEGNNAVIQVADDGLGVAPADLTRIFEMFARLERQRVRGDRGAGIGLALAKRLAEMHGGRLTAWSAGEGQGTTFTLTLPGFRRPTFDAAAGGSETEAPKDQAAPLEVLVVEDSADVSDVLQSWLEDEGHHVQVAATGQRGIELAVELRPDIVLCDIGLPDMDGTEVSRKVHELLTGKTRPLLVALTGWGQPEDRRRTAEAGFDQHLLKPVATDTLAAVLKSVPRNRARRPS